MLSADLMFSVNDFEYITQAAVAFNEKLDAYWPLDHLNAALCAIYTEQSELPWIYTIFDKVGPIGYLVMTRNDRRSSEEIEELFWSTLALNNMANPANKEFLVDTPCWGYTGELSEPMAAVGYIPPINGHLRLPTAPINDAIHMLMRQPGWPRNSCVYLYPVRKAGDPLIGGLLLMDTMDGLNENVHLDDAIFNSIREQNITPGKGWDSFQRKRYDL